MRFTLIFILFLSIVSCKKDKQSNSTIPQESQTDEVTSNSDDTSGLKQYLQKISLNLKFWILRI